jgi:hypothetical protein
MMATSRRRNTFNALVNGLLVDFSPLEVLFSEFSIIFNPHYSIGRGAGRKTFIQMTAIVPMLIKESERGQIISWVGDFCPPSPVNTQWTAFAVHCTSQILCFFIGL